MSLAKLTRLPSGRLLSSLHLQQQLCLPSITPVTVPPRSMIHGEYRRPGKPKENKYPWQKINFDFSKGLEGIKNNITLLRKEFFDRWVGPEGKPLLEHMLEQNQVVWEFKGPESLQQWIVSSDLEIGGKSEVHLKMGKSGQTCFLYGNLDSTPPRDGETRYSGYCTMRSKQAQVGWYFDYKDPNSHGCQYKTVPNLFSLRVPLIERSTSTGPPSTRCTCVCVVTAVHGWSTSQRRPTSLTRKTTFTVISCTPEAGPTGRMSR